MTTPSPSSFKPVILTDEPGVAFLRRHPATREVVTTLVEAGRVEAALHFRDDAAVPPDDQWAMPNANVPDDRHADLSFENSGHAPPLGFWVTHPDILAWTTSALDGDDEDWWVKVWLKG
jgi:hypothetical protein